LARDEAKIGRVRDAMRKEGFNTLVLRIPENVTYLSDAWCGQGLTYLIFPLEGDPVLIHPAGEVPPTTWVSDSRLYPVETVDVLDDAVKAGTESVRTTLLDLGIRSGTVGVEQAWELVQGTYLRYEVNVSGERTIHALRERLSSYDLRDASSLLTRMRSVKTSQEVAKLRKANRVAEAGLETFERDLKPGVSEIELAARIEHDIVTDGILKHRVRRAVACAFVASGPTTAEAYKSVVGNTRRKLRRGDLAMLELDVVVDGYSSDTTRTFVVGKPRKDQKRLIDAVLDSETTAISAIRPQATASEITRISNDVISRHGLSEYLVHGLGHGIGVSVHEPIPTLHLRSKDVLQPGMTHTVEPGIYGRRIGGVRIEDDILVTQEGAKYLSTFRRTPE
jgi:Xaa-Pro aminopeptidase